MSAFNGVYEDSDLHMPCDGCGEDHPEGVLDGGLCPSCVDDEPECDCPDKVPADLPPEGWSCPKCDAQWFPEDDEASS